MSFRSNVVSIKCRFNQVSFDQVSFDQLSGHKKYIEKNENNLKTLQFTNCCTLQHTDTIENNSNTTVYKQNSVNC